MSKRTNFVDVFLVFLTIATMIVSAAFTFLAYENVIPWWHSMLLDAIFIGILLVTISNFKEPRSDDSCNCCSYPNCERESDCRG